MINKYFYCMSFLSRIKLNTFVECKVISKSLNKHKFYVNPFYAKFSVIVLVFKNIFVEIFGILQIMLRDTRYPGVRRDFELVSFKYVNVLENEVTL